jgi:hypothetical protein
MALLAFITGAALWGVGGYVSLRAELAKGDGVRASVRTLQAFVAGHRGACWLGVLAAALLILWVGRATLAAVASFSMLPARLALVGPAAMTLGAGLALLQRSADEEV